MKINKKVIQEKMIINEWQIKDIAREAGLSRATVSRALHGGDLVPASISKLYKALNVDIEELIDWGSNG